MARARYPSPKEAVSNYLEAVKDTSIQRKWGSRCAKGAEDLGEYFKKAFPSVYGVIASDKFQTEEDPWERSRMVGTKISEVAKEYRKAKVEELAKLAAGTPE